MNTFGRIFKITIYGSSHGEELGVVIDGCPVGIRLLEDDFICDIERRKPQDYYNNTSRKENDKILIRSGIYNGFTDGTPILLSFKNENTISKDYNFVEEGFFRPGTADFTANRKYKGFNNPNGGGMFSGRMTLALVAAGVIAKKTISDIKITSIVNSESEILCTINNVPVGWGEPFFDSVEAVISHAIFSIPGAKGIEFGNIKSIASEYNDTIIDAKGTTKTNNAGGINGGISNGNDIYFTVKFRPPASIEIEQKTYNFKTQEIEKLTIKGRHDTCYINRTPVIVEAATAMVLADLFLLKKENHL